MFAEGKEMDRGWIRRKHVQEMFELFLKAYSDNIQHDSFLLLLPSDSGIVSLLKL